MLFFGTGMIVVDLKHVGTPYCSSQKMKMVVNTTASWSAQPLRMCPETPSGPDAFLMLSLLKAALTLCCLVLMEAVFVGLPLVDQADSWSLHSAGQIEQKNWFKVLGRELSMGLGATLLVLYPVRAFIPNWIYHYILY